MVSEVVGTRRTTAARAGRERVRAEPFSGRPRRGERMGCFGVTGRVSATAEVRVAELGIVLARQVLGLVAAALNVMAERLQQGEVRVWIDPIAGTDP
jgi:hypothetical protein